MPKSSSSKYYQDKKETVQNKACGRYESLSKEEKEEKQQYSCEQYKNPPENQKLVEYRKKYYKLRKKPFSFGKFDFFRPAWRLN